MLAGTLSFFRRELQLLQYVMYEKFFSLDELPFDGLPDERFFYVGSSQREALSLLSEQLMRQGAVCVLYGPSGSGKTTLVRMLIRSLPNRQRIITIDDPRITPHTLLATLLRSCGIVASSYESIPELTFKLRSYLDGSSVQSQGTLLIVDEAQGLSDDCLEQLRLISNIEGKSGQRVSILLAGQDYLKDRIREPLHHMLLSRVKTFAAVKALNKEEMYAYLSFRLQQSGCRDPLFSPRALKAIYKGSHGLPRLINSIADRALSLACEQKKHNVTYSVAKKAVMQVRSRGFSFKTRLRRYLKYLAKLGCIVVPFTAMGAFLALVSFVACYYFLPNVVKNSTFESVLKDSEAMHVASERYIESSAWRQTSRGRQLQLLNADIKKSVFKSDLETTLINVWGYARKDGKSISCNDLEKTGLYCALGQGSIDEVFLNGRPAVLSMLDDDLMPYYALLYKVNSDDTSNLIMGNHMFTIKNSYLRKHFLGNFTVVLPEYEELAEPSSKDYKKDLVRLEEMLALKKGVLSSQDDYKKALRAFEFRYPNEEDRNLVIDLFSGVGPYLCDEQERRRFLANREQNK